MRRLYHFILLFSISVNIFGQNDQQAVRILDKLSSVATTAPSVSMKFTVLTINQVENKRDSSNGSVIISKNQYYLELPDNITWFDGTTSWSYLKAEKEVTITKPDKKDESFLGKPSGIFTLYKKGYKVRLIEENERYQIVDLYPSDIKSELVRIRLTISKPGSELLEAEYRRKDGITVFLKVKEYNLKIKPGPDTFTFNPQKYKSVEIIDMR
jgi:outer membrane lipoprotein-sorting protein